MIHSAEILAVGTELLLGNTINSNAAEISEALSELGINVFWHTVVGDNPERLKDALALAKSRADLIVTTGGLGPTYDDLTKQTICEAFDEPLVFMPEYLEKMEAFFTSAHKELHMTSNNRQQAYLPEHGVIFDNLVGTAPGCAICKDGVHVCMLPGPPHEMRSMLQNGVLPYLRSLSNEVIVSHNLMTFGRGESELEILFREEMESMTNPSLATYCKPSEVRFRATAKAKTQEEAEAMLAPVVAKVSEKLGDVLYGIDTTGLPETCLKLLKAQGKTLATAESCTGGKVSASITEIPGSSSVFKGGVVSYWTDIKASVLHVPQDLLDEYGAVSEPTARAMAEQVRALMETDLAVSVTGVAGPDPDERNNPVGLVYIGLATPEGTFCRKMQTGGHRSRQWIQALAVNHALDLVRRYLTDLPLEIQGPKIPEIN